MSKTYTLNQKKKLENNNFYEQFLKTLIFFITTFIMNEPLTVTKYYRQLISKKKTIP